MNGPCNGTDDELAQPSPCVASSLCPAGTINLATSLPPDMSARSNTMVDARYPDVAGGSSVTLGIGNPNGTNDDRIRIQFTTSVSGADLVACWCLCETAIDAGFGPNSITCVEDLTNGLYEVHLARPITTKARTTISYKNSGPYMTYIAHPANVNGDGAAGPTDILTLIDHLNGVLVPPLLVWQCDIDHSAVCAAADIIGEIDMLNGANGFAVANATTKPAVGLCPGAASCAAGQLACGESSSFSQQGQSSGSDMEDAQGVSCDNACISDYVTNLLAGFDGTNSLSETELTIVVDALAQWCLAHFSSSERAFLVEQLFKAEYSSQIGYLAAARLTSSLVP